MFAVAVANVRRAHGNNMPVEPNFEEVLRAGEHKISRLVTPRIVTDIEQVDPFPCEMPKVSGAQDMPFISISGPLLHWGGTVIDRLAVAFHWWAMELTRGLVDAGAIFSGTPALYFKREAYLMEGFGWVLYATKKPVQEPDVCAHMSGRPQ